MERVKKGEKYWCILCDCDGIDVEEWEDNNFIADRALYKIGNYFHAKEDAEAMAEKIRKVLKGADVIEMLSEDEIEAKAYDISADWLEQDYMQVAYDAALKMADWLKSKIVK